MSFTDYGKSERVKWKRKKERKANRSMSETRICDDGPWLCMDGAVIVLTVLLNGA